MVLPECQLVRNPIRYRKENIVTVKETPVLLAKNVYQTR
jgi:hypothetical protein